VKATTQTGMEQLRALVNAFDHCRESFFDPFTPVQLLAIHAAWMASKWDYRPDSWTGRQVREALRGIAPQWNDDSSPRYTPRVKVAS